MAKIIELTGQQFGYWTVLYRAKLPKPESNGTIYGWMCRCQCGTERVVSGRLLRSGESLSCGCVTATKARERINVDNVLQRYDGTVVSTIRYQRKPNKNNKSGHKGVYWSSSEKRWIAKIGLRGKSITIGRFENMDDAVSARIAAEKQYYDPIINAYDNNHNK